MTMTTNTGNHYTQQLFGTMATRFIPFIIFPKEKIHRSLSNIWGRFFRGNWSSCDLLPQGCAGEQ